MAVKDNVGLVLARAFVVTVATAAALSFAPARARAAPAVVDRIVAIVGEDPILLSDVRKRAVPFNMQIALKVSDPKERAAAETAVVRELLDKMIGERLFEKEAERLHISVTGDDIDRALESVAKQNGLAMDALFAEALKQGMSASDYRAELKRQILEGKLLMVHVAGKLPSTMSEAERMKKLDEERNKWIQELKEHAYVDVRL